MVRRGKFKYIHYVGFSPEFYDLEADPEELADLSGSSAHQGLLREFEAILRRMVDPEKIDRRAKIDQAALVERHGGREAIIQKGGANATPIPGEVPKFTSK